MSSTINIVLAQRLLRKVCKFCAKEIDTPQDLKKKFEEILKDTPDLPKDLQRGKMWQAVGCEKCGNLGYKGRMGIFEAVLMDEEINKVVNDNPNETDIMRAAKKQKIWNMKEDGIIKVLQGITTYDELVRVIDLDN